MKTKLYLILSSATVLLICLLLGFFTSIKNLQFVSVVIVAAVIVMLISLINDIIKKTSIFISLFSQATEGNLSVRYDISNDKKNDFDLLGDALNKFLDKFEINIAQLKSNTNEIKNFSNMFNEQLQSVADASKDTSNNISNTTSSVLEFSATIQSISESINSQSAAVTETTASAESISSSVKKINQDMHYVKDAINQTSTAIEQMSANINNITSTVNTLNNHAIENGQAASEGKKNINEAIVSMNDINSSLNKLVTVMEELGVSANNITKIIEVIDDISEQTNLLALNAAIEAARAGESGRGFAVVADEVRKLAVKSSDSTKEIFNIVKTIQNKTNTAISDAKSSLKLSDEGTRTVNETGESLNNIIEKVTNMNQLVNEVTGAMNEANEGGQKVTEQVEKLKEFTNKLNDILNAQSIGLTEIVEAMNSIAALTDQIKHSMAEQKIGVEQIQYSMESIDKASSTNAKSTEKASAGIMTLLTISDELQELISEFKISSKIKIPEKKSGNLLDWNDKYSVKITEIDNQHKKLFNLINTLYSAMISGKGNSVMGSILDELIQYTATHFKYEEDLFEKYNYAEIEQHKKIHKNLVSKVLETQKEFKEGKSLSVEVMNFLRNWLIDHIGQTDMKYSPFLNSKGIK